MPCCMYSGKLPVTSIQRVPVNDGYHRSLRVRCCPLTGSYPPDGSVTAKVSLRRARTAAIANCCRCFAAAPQVGSPPILWKNTRLLAQNAAPRFERERLSCQAFRGCCGAGRSLAILRRFWAVAARRNSSFAPHGPRNRSRFRPKIRLRWAKSISTFFLSFIEMTYCSVLAMSRATCRASSCSSRVILRASALGQHFALDGQAWQT